MFLKQPSYIIFFEKLQSLAVRETCARKSRGKSCKDEEKNTTLEQC